MRRKRKNRVIERVKEDQRRMGWKETRKGKEDREEGGSVGGREKR